MGEDKRTWPKASISQKRGGSWEEGKRGKVWGKKNGRHEGKRTQMGCIFVVGQQRRAFKKKGEGGKGDRVGFFQVLDELKRLFDGK